MSTPSISMPITCAIGVVVALDGEVEPARCRPAASRTAAAVLCVVPGRERLRYCCISASCVVGRPSMTMVPRARAPVRAEREDARARGTSGPGSARTGPAAP